jgi:hypothetical protein
VTFLPGQIQRTISVAVRAIRKRNDETFFPSTRHNSAQPWLEPLSIHEPPPRALAAVAPCLMLPADLTLSATASDPDGLVSRVEFMTGRTCSASWPVRLS